MEKFLKKIKEEADIFSTSEEKLHRHVVTKSEENKSETLKCFTLRNDCEKQCVENMKKDENVSDKGKLPVKRARLDDGFSAYNLAVCPHTWRPIKGENLNLKYTRIFSRKTADYVLDQLEKEIEYFSGDLLKVKVYGKWYDIPRKQVSYGDSGLSYTFSGTCVPAVPWSKCKIVMELKKLVESVSGHSFNFVLVNRYKDGNDHMGEHRDDEKDLMATAPIASLSLGQARDFIFKHKDARGQNATRKINPVVIELEHGSLLMMEWPTNKFWYHSLPVRRKANNVRINLTFRQMVIKNK